MNLLNYVIILACVFLIAIGQILFKLSAKNMKSDISVLDLAVSPTFLLALAIYGLATLGWVSQLRTVNLSVAYPLMSLSFVIVPLASWLVLAEPIAPRYWVGLVMILAGIVLAGSSR